MKPPNHHSRINLHELKAQIVKKLGPEGSKQYFYHLNLFLSSKSSKVEFDKLCLRILGRENIWLHNQFIRSILKNACSSKAPSLVSQKNDIPADCYQQNGSHTGATHASGLLNGVVMLPVSPKKTRTKFRDRRIVESRSALDSNGKTENVNPVKENGHLHPSDIGFLVAHPVNKISVPKRSMDQIVSVAKKDGKEDACLRSPARAPLGVPLCSVSIGGARREESSSNSFMTDVDLPDSHSLQERMGQIALAQSLEGVSVECANVLNHGLDLYMKRLISSCIDLVGGRTGRDLLMKNKIEKQKLINGFTPGYQYQIQNSGVQEQRISLQDFRVAMELNPKQLGEDWPLLLEKICIRAFED